MLNLPLRMVYLSSRPVSPSLLQIAQGRTFVESRQRVAALESDKTRRVTSVTRANSLSVKKAQHTQTYRVLRRLVQLVACLPHPCQLGNINSEEVRNKAITIPLVSDIRQVLSTVRISDARLPPLVIRFHQRARTASPH